MANASRIRGVKVKKSDKYTCPICDYRVKSPRDAARPKLEDLMSGNQRSSPFHTRDGYSSPDYRSSSKFRNSSALNQIRPGLTSAEVPTMRILPRKIEGAEILLSRDQLLPCGVAKWMPIATRAPTIVYPHRLAKPGRLSSRN